MGISTGGFTGEPARAAVDDRALDANDGDVAAEPQPGRGPAHCACAPDPSRRCAPGSAAEALRQLLLRQHGVDHMFAPPPVRRCTASRRRACSGIVIQLAAVLDRLDELLVLRFQQPRNLLAQLVRHLRLREDVGRRSCTARPARSRPRCRTREAVAPGTCPSGEARAAARCRSASAGSRRTRTRGSRCRSCRTAPTRSLACPTSATGRPARAGPAASPSTSAPGAGEAPRP